MELKTASANVLNQLSAVIRQMSDEEFTRQVPGLHNSTLGQHIRHTLEFYTCLIDGYKSGFVNYDKRNHDHRIESDKDLALAVIDDILKFLDKDHPDKKFTLEVCYNEEEEINFAVESSFMRELVYNVEHAIHHMALIKVGVREICPQIELDNSFGVAVSTLRYQKTRTQS